MDRPWLKFYPADWQADELLGMCTLAARGLWLEMIGIMHKATPYGHLLVNGRNPTDVQLAALARCPPDQVPGLLEELENAGVFSRARNRTIYSRRMTRDEKRRKDGQIGKITGKKVPFSRRSQAIEKANGNVSTLKVATKVAGQPPSTLEARVQNPERKKSSPDGEPKESRPTRLPVGFVMPPEWLDDGQLARQRHDLPDIDLLLQSELFCNYWWSKGPAATKSDWHKTWTNWCLNAHNAAPLGGNDHGRKQSPGEKLFEGAYRAAVAFDERQRARVEVVEPLLDGERSGSNAGGANSGLARRPH